MDDDISALGILLSWLPLIGLFGIQWWVSLSTTRKLVKAQLAMTAALQGIEQKMANIEQRLAQRQGPSN